MAQLKKFAEGSGLGISLEGTVDVENGKEVRPHHYIRSILPEGPVGQDGTLRSGDELLEVQITNSLFLISLNLEETSGNGILTSTVFFSLGEWLSLVGH